MTLKCGRRLEGEVLLVQRSGKTKAPGWGEQQEGIHKVPSTGQVWGSSYWRVTQSDLWFCEIMVAAMEMSQACLMQSRQVSWEGLSSLGGRQPCPEIKVITMQAHTR